MATLSAVIAGVTEYYESSDQGAPAEAVVRLNAQSAVDAINDIRRYEPVIEGLGDDVVVHLVEDKYLSRAIRIAIYLCEKEGVDGTIAFSENGVSRSFEAGDIPASLLRGVTPVCFGYSK